MSNRMDEIAELQRQRHKILEQIRVTPIMSKDITTLVVELKTILNKIKGV